MLKPWGQRVDPLGQNARQQRPHVLFELGHDQAHRIGQGREAVQDPRLIVGKFQAQQPRFGIAPADAVEEGDDVPGALQQVGRPGSAGQLGRGLEHLAQDAPDALDDAPHDRDQGKDQHDQQYPFPDAFTRVRIVDQADHHGDDVAHGRDIPHQRDHPDHRIDQDLRQRSLLVERTLRRAPGPAADIGGHRAKLAPAEPARGRC